MFHRASPPRHRPRAERGSRDDRRLPRHEVRSRGAFVTGRLGSSSRRLRAFGSARGTGRAGKLPPEAADPPRLSAGRAIRRRTRSRAPFREGGRARVSTQARRGPTRRSTLFGTRLEVVGERARRAWEARDTMQVSSCLERRIEGWAEHRLGRRPSARRAVRRRTMPSDVNGDPVTRRAPLPLDGEHAPARSRVRTVHHALVRDESLARLSSDKVLLTLRLQTTGAPVHPFRIPSNPAPSRPVVACRPLTGTRGLHAERSSRSSPRSRTCGSGARHLERVGVKALGEQCPRAIFAEAARR